MQDPETFQLPYLLRDMLHFEYGSTFELVILSKAESASQINIVGATREGTFKFTHTTTNSDLFTTERFNIPDIPIWVTVLDKNLNITPFTVFCSLRLGVNGDILHNLTSGYVHTVRNLSWPMVETLNPENIRGRVTTKTSADPAAGVEVSITVPIGETWRIIAINFTLVTGAVAGNRFVHIKLENSGTVAAEIITSNSQIISSTVRYNARENVADVTQSDNGVQLLDLPSNFLLTEGERIITATTNLNALDNFSAMTVMIEKYINLSEQIFS